MELIKYIKIIRKTDKVIPLPNFIAKTQIAEEIIIPPREGNKEIILIKNLLRIFNVFILFNETIMAAERIARLGNSGRI